MWMVCGLLLTILPQYCLSNKLMKWVFSHLVRYFSSIHLGNPTRNTRKCSRKSKYVPLQIHISWYFMIFHDISWYFMIFHGLLVVETVAVFKNARWVAQWPWSTMRWRPGSTRCPRSSGRPTSPAIPMCSSWRCQQIPKLGLESLERSESYCGKHNSMVIWFIYIYIYWFTYYIYIYCV